MSGGLASRSCDRESLPRMVPEITRMQIGPVNVLVDRWPGRSSEATRHLCACRTEKATRKQIMAGSGLLRILPVELLGSGSRT